MPSPTHASFCVLVEISKNSCLQSMRGMGACPSNSERLLLFFDVVDSVRALIRLYEHNHAVLSQTDRGIQDSLVRILVNKFKDPHFIAHLSPTDTLLFFRLRDEVFQVYEPTPVHDIWIK